MAAYREAAGRDPRGSRRGRRAGALFAVLLLVLGVPIVALGFAFGGPATGVTLLVLVGAAILALSLLGGRKVRRHDVRQRSEAWGLEAFAREYARTRGLQMEERDEFRRRLLMPLRGSPQKCMRGQFANGVVCHLVLWRDQVHDSGMRRLSNLAVVPAPGDAAPSAAGGRYDVIPAGRWLVVAETIERGGRCVAGLDALLTEAVRIASS